MFEIEHYLTEEGQDLIGGWLSGLQDNHAKARIAMRINRLKSGNFGDCKPLDEMYGNCVLIGGLTTAFTMLKLDKY